MTQPRQHFLVIGGQRCGTTYLHTMLDAHPDITMARPARPEPKVFLDAEKSARGLGWYRETYFAHAAGEARWGEKSTSYIESAEAASRAAEVLGDADILVLLRDPVVRAVSNWRFSTDNGFETRPLAEAFEANLADSPAWDAAGPRSRRSPTSSAAGSRCTSSRGARPSPTGSRCTSSRSCWRTTPRSPGCTPASTWTRLPARGGREAGQPERRARTGPRPRPGGPPRATTQRATAPWPRWWVVTCPGPPPRKVDPPPACTSQEFPR